MQIQYSLPWLLSLGATFCPAQSLTIRLYDYTALTVEESVRSARVTEVVFGHAGIQVGWVYCRGVLAMPESAACTADLGTNEIIVRLVLPEENRSPSSRSELGHAIAHADGGRYASVFVPAVRTRAAEWQMAFDLVLGYAIAHEAAHCLLGPKHASTGLMRSSWTRADALGMAQLRLGLSKQESVKASARLAQPSLEAARGISRPFQQPTIYTVERR
jgi:hypothetical protein